jgi:hypothetical protein
MRATAATAAVLLAATVGSSPVAAQARALLDISGGTVRYDGYLESSVLTLTPTLILEQPNATIHLSSNLSKFESGSWSLDGTAGASMLTAAVHHIRAELSGSTTARSYLKALEDNEPAFGRRANVLGSARVLYSSVPGGIWVGVGGGAAYSRAAWHDVSRFDGGAWGKLGDVTVRAVVQRTSFADSVLQNRDASFTFVDAVYFDAGVSAVWTYGRVELEGGRGARMQAGVQAIDTWNAVGTFWLNRHVAVMLSSGRYAPDLAEQLPGGTFGTVALRYSTRAVDITPSPRPLVRDDVAMAYGFEVRGNDERARTIRIHVRHAEHVEISADFTDWQVVSLEHQNGDEWEVVLPISTGVHRINLRIDGGGWIVPPGLPAEADDFNGVVGLLIVGADQT